MGSCGVGAGLLRMAIAFIVALASPGRLQVEGRKVRTKFDPEDWFLQRLEDNDIYQLCGLVAQKHVAPSWAAGPGAAC